MRSTIEIRQAPVQQLFQEQHLSASVLRLDLVHPLISGNKWFKLKYNLEAASRLKNPLLLTFGGPHSNHLVATAAACRDAGIPCVSVVRGEQIYDTPGLDTCRELGMRLHFVSRETYRSKDTPSYRNELLDRFGEHWLVPEGGANEEGVRGAAEILDRHEDFTHVFCACGTATTFAGLVRAAGSHQVICGISVLKGRNELPVSAEKLLHPEKAAEPVVGSDSMLVKGHAISNAWALGGYAAYHEDLVRFQNEFEEHYGIPLDPVYTVKMFYAFFQLREKGILPSGSRVLLIHSGGLQGRAAFFHRYQRKLKR